VVTFTSQAHAELARRAAASADPDQIVVVGWATAVFDLVRSPEGKALWKEEYPAQWRVWVLDLSRLADGISYLYGPEGAQRHYEESCKWAEGLVRIEGLRVLFLPEGSGASDVTVDFRDGQFRIQQRTV